MIHDKFRCEFFFVRHGESASNANLGWMGATDHDSLLTEKGVRQARALGKRFRGEGVRFDRAYSSTFPRAVTTADLILESMGQADLPVVQEDALIEREILAWRGMGTEDALDEEALAYMETKSSDFVPPTGESHRMARRRLSAWLEDEIIYNEELHREPTELKVIVSTHGDVINNFLHYVMGFDERFLSRIEPDNCSVSRCAFTRRGWRVESVNDSAHVFGV